MPMRSYFRLGEADGLLTSDTGPDAGPYLHLIRTKYVCQSRYHVHPEPQMRRCRPSLSERPLTKWIQTSGVWVEQKEEPRNDRLPARNARNCRLESCPARKRRL